MDVHHALRTRRTVHLYRPAPLPAGALDRALEAAVQAPNHRHTRPWRFTLVGPETRAALAEIAVEAKRAKRGDLSPEGEAAARAKVTTPAGLIVLRQVLCEDDFTREEDYASLACAAQSVMLSLHADGVGSKWSTGGVTRHARTYELLGIDPERERIVGFLWAGIADKVPDPPKPAVEDLVVRLP